MKKLIITSALTITLAFTATAQVGVGTTTPQATLEVSGDKGMLLPRMADHTVIVPVDGTLDTTEKGLIVYNTVLNKAFIWDGTAWAEATAAEITASNGLTKTGNDVKLGGTLTENTAIATGNFDLNVDNTTLYVDGSANVVGIGVNNPTAKLDVNGTARVRAFGTGSDTDQIVSTDSNGNLRTRTTEQIVETRILAGSIRVGDVQESAANIIIGSNVQGFIASGFKDGSCGITTNSNLEDMCVTVSFPSLGTTNYAVNVTYRSNTTSFSGNTNIDTTGELLPPLVYDKLQGSFKVFIEETSQVTQDLWLEIIVTKY